jgi:hypothetical protein
MALMVTKALPNETKTLPNKKALSDREAENRMSYITFVINEFPETYNMNKPEGYRYLKQYGGLDYLCEHWWALHIDNQEHVMRDIFNICKRNGGYL